MNRTFCLIVILAFVSSLLAEPRPYVPPEKKTSKVLLAPVLKKGDTFPWTWSINVRDKMTNNDPESDDLQSETLWGDTLGVELVVENVAADGTVSMKMIFRHMAKKNRYRGTTSQYDSQHDEKYSKEQWYRPILHPMIGESLTFTLAPDGQVSNMSGMEAIINKIKDSGADPRLIKMYDTLLSNDMYEYMIGCLYGLFPCREASVGDQWKRKYPYSFKNADINYTLASIDEDKHVATVTFEGNMDYKSHEAESSPYRYEPRFATIEGTARLDTKKGTILDYTSNTQNVSDVIYTPKEGPKQHGHLVRSGQQTGTPVLFPKPKASKVQTVKVDAIDRTKKFRITRNYFPGMLWRTRFSRHIDTYSASEFERKFSRDDLLFTSYDWRFFVRDKAPDGTLDMQVTITRINTLIQKFDKTIRYDSHKLENMEPEDIDKYMAPLIGGVITFTVSPDRNISNLEGLLSLFDQFYREDNDPETEMLIWDMYNRYEFQYLLSQYFSYFPGHPVGIGDSWEQTISSEDQTNKVQYTVKDILDIEGRAVAQIQYEAEITHKKDEQALSSETTHLSDDMHGTLLIEIGTGKLVKNEETFHSESETVITFALEDKDEDDKLILNVKDRIKGRLIVLDNPPYMPGETNE